MTRTETAQHILENGVNRDTLDSVKKNYPYSSNDNRFNDIVGAREMVISCIVYGQDYDFYDRNTDEIGKYGKFFKTLTADEIKHIYFTQKQYMNEHARIKTGVYEDGEGVRYNSVQWE